MKNIILIFLILTYQNVLACKSLQNLSSFLTQTQDLAIENCGDMMYFDDESCDCSSKMVSIYPGIKNTNYNLEIFNEKLIDKAKTSLFAIASDISSLKNDNFSKNIIPECDLTRLDVSKLCGGNTKNLKP